MAVDLEKDRKYVVTINHYTFSYFVEFEFFFSFWFTEKAKWDVVFYELLIVGMNFDVHSSRFYP